MERGFPPADALVEHANFVRALSRRLLATEGDDADDLAQEALLRYVQSPPRDTPDPRPWFVRVVRNLAHNRRRENSNRRAREARAARAESTEGAEEALARESVLRSVVEAVLALEEPYRSTILARYYAGHAPARIAEETATPVATVKSRLARAHQQLRERLDRSHGSRDAWGLALGSLIDVGTPLGATGVGGGLAWGIAAALLALGGLGSAGWFLRRELAADDASSATTASLVAPPSPRAASDATDLGAPDAGARAPVSASSAATWIAEGVVTDAAYAPLALTGGPAAGVAVTIELRRLGVAPRTFQARGTTDASGKFRIEFASPSHSDAAETPALGGEADDAAGASFDSDVRFELFVAAAGDARWRPATQVGEWPLGERAKLDARLSRSAWGLTTGEVVDASGSPLADVALNLNGDRAVSSDAQGRIQLALPGPFTSAQLLDPELSIVEVTPPVPSPLGGQDGLRVVASRRASVTLRARDAAGAPVAKLDVRVEPSTMERERLGACGASVAAIRATTDEQGVARLGGLWPECKLTVTLLATESNHKSSAVRAGRLLFGDDALDGESIVLRGGEDRELLAEWAAPLWIEGRIESADGSTVVDAVVSVADLGLGSRGASAWVRAQSDATGNYRIEMKRRERVGPFWIVATSVATESPIDVGLGYVGADARIAESRAERIVAAAPGSDGVLRADLRIAPTLSIRGHVFESDGSPLERPENALRITCRSTELGGLVRELPTDEPLLRWNRDGSFEIEGLCAGRYDLGFTRVTFPTFYSWHESPTWLPATPAGGPRLRVVLGERLKTRVKVRVVGEGLRGAIALRAKRVDVSPGGESPSRGPLEAAPPLTIVDGASGWPAHAPLGFTGISGGEDSDGRWSSGFDGFDDFVRADGGVQSHEFELPPMDPGVYVIGVHPIREDGANTFPQASAPLRLDEGDYEVEFRSLGVQMLGGRVTELPEGLRVGVQLVDAAGRAIPILPDDAAEGLERPTLLRELDAAGRFHVARAPAGDLRVRIGTLRELEQGRFRFELESAAARAVAGRAPPQWSWR